MCVCVCEYFNFDIRIYMLNKNHFVIMQNVLHWHIVDTQSFPLEIPSYPKLWNGAYSLEERYTMADAAEIVRQVSITSSECNWILQRMSKYLSIFADMLKDKELTYCLSLIFQGTHNPGRQSEHISHYT